VTFIPLNISPTSHVYDITKPKPLILHIILFGRSLNMERQIDWEIHRCANTSSSIASLGNSSLITHLYKRARVDVSLPPLEHLFQIIDINYINRYCSAREGSVTPAPPL